MYCIVPITANTKDSDILTIEMSLLKSIQHKYFVVLAVFVIFIVVLSIVLLVINKQSAPNSSETNKRYIGKSPEACAVIDFGCPEGQELFNDEYGCGCEQK